MTKYKFQPTGRERGFADDEIIVSKTDRQGRITYGNHVFHKISGYPEKEIIGAPHSILRHPDMPRCVFRLLWERIQGGKEIFAYVVNMAMGGDHYWVFAHVTPTVDATGAVSGFHSNRRRPAKSQVQTISAIYRELSAIEDGTPDRKLGLEQSYRRLMELTQAAGTDYDEFIFSF